MPRSWALSPPRPCSTASTESHSKDEGDGLQTLVSSDLLRLFLLLACLPSSCSHTKALAKMPFPQEAFSTPSLDSPSLGSFPLVLWVWKYLCLVLSLSDWRLLREHRPDVDRLNGFSDPTVGIWYFMRTSPDMSRVQTGSSSV